MELIKFLGVCGIVLMIVDMAKPIQWIKEYYGIGVNDTVKIPKGSKKNLYKSMLHKLINCAMCLGFWVGLAFYLDLYFAVCISFASEILHRLLSKLFIYI